MKRYVKIFIVMGCFFLLVGMANAQHLVDAYLRYDARFGPEFLYGRGGPEGHSGAYIQIYAAVGGYNDITDIRIWATHKGTGFTVSLVEEDPSCVGVWPFNADQYFDAYLRPEEWWMTGEWEITMEYRGRRGKRIETKTVIVPRFNFPPAPTGVQIGDYQGQTYIVWNRIGDPGTGPGKHVEYRIVHYTRTPPRCIDESLTIRQDGGYPYELWSGNRIAVPLPGNWNSGDLIRIENRVYDDNPTTNGPYREDRGTRYVFLP